MLIHLLQMPIRCVWNEEMRVAALDGHGTDGLEEAMWEIIDRLERRSATLFGGKARGHVVRSCHRPWRPQGRKLCSIANSNSLIDPGKADRACAFRSVAQNGKKGEEWQQCGLIQKFYVIRDACLSSLLRRSGPLCALDVALPNTTTYIYVQEASS